MNNLCKTLIIKQLKVVGKSPLQTFAYPLSKAGPMGFVLDFFVPAGILGFPLGFLFTPPGPLSEGEARSGKELDERLGREPAAGRFPPLRGGARQGGGVKKQLGNY